MRRGDLLWALAYPVYQIIGTLRHEGSHALAAMAEGARVTKFVFWPNFDLGRFHWGYVDWGYSTWFATAAPYFCDLITFFVALLIILEAKTRRRWLRINILIIGMWSPFLNSAYSYGRGLASGRGDTGELLSVLDPTAVHLYFAVTLVLYAWGLYYCYFRKKTWHPE
jgi:ABC-type spermidine/putrescine transport system permease subunit I